MSSGARPWRALRETLAAALLIALPAGGWAQSTAPADWSARLRDTSQALHAGQWEQARTTVEALLVEMRESIASGAGAAPSLGVATMYRAVAEAGLGEREAAAWDLWMAMSLLPALAEADLGGFGAAGAQLDAERRAPPASGPAAGSGGPTSRPARRSGEVPKFPFGKAQVCHAEKVKVRAVIGSDGRPARPRVDAGADPVLAYAAMEALRDWRFEPATRDGRPVPVDYALTIDYQVLNCPPAATGAPHP